MPELHRPSGRRALGLALALLTMGLWGVLPFALKLALTWLDPATLTWFRFLVSALVLGAVLASRGGLPAVGRLPRSGWALLAVATLGLAGNYIAFLLGLDRTTPANAQVLIQLAPLLFGLGAIAVFGERFGALQWLGFAVLVAGLALFFRSQLAALARDLDRYLSGAALLAVAAATWAAYGLAQKQLLRALSSQGVMLCIFAGCTLCFWPWAHPAALVGLSAGALAVLLFCAANTLVAYGAFAAALAHWEASRVSAVLALTPLATLAFSALVVRVAPERFAAEPLSTPSLGGAAMVVVGSLLTSLGGGREG
ncbi:MAG TPA: DMT family transporter [Myxococcota bacterium]|nr:DMT family transporter [Myxococcota bacterium]